MNRHTGFYFILVIIIFLGCTKSNKQDTNPATHIQYDTTKPSDDLAKRYFFKTGSYWIYKDSASGQIDSFYVSNTEVTMYQQSGPASPGGNGVLIAYLFLYSSYITDININAFPTSGSISWQQVLNKKYCELLLYNGSGPISTSYYPLFTYPLGSELTTWYFPATVAQLVANTTMELNGSTYQHVYAFSHQNSVKNDQFYICDSIGIIKMRIDHSSDTDTTHHIWELQRYHTTF